MTLRTTSAGPDLATEEFFVPAREPGIVLYLRNKRPASLARFEPSNVVLFVHGATYPCESGFDLALDGVSWMDYIAAGGYDVWFVDVRGYGRSTRPPAMDAPPQEGAPFASTEDAAADVAAAAAFVRQRRAVDRLVLIGWSWGTAIMSLYTSRHNEAVEKLVLYAPLWHRRTPSPIGTGDGPLGAYRCVTMQAARQRWLAHVPPDKVDGLIPDGWFEQWAQATLASDPQGARRDPPVVRAPNGVVADTARFAAQGGLPWSAADIRVPTLLVKAEWDGDTPAYMAQEYFAALTRTPYKAYLEIGEGTHSVILERNRMQVFRAVRHFLDDPGP